jgi:hypothetical protein
LSPACLTPGTFGEQFGNHHIRCSRPRTDGKFSVELAGEQRASGLA